MSAHVCTVCGLYFASEKLLAQHAGALHKRSELNMVCRRSRPSSIIKTKNDQALCLVKEYSGEESAKWIDVEDIETIDMPLNEE